LKFSLDFGDKKIVKYELKRDKIILKNKTGLIRSKDEIPDDCNTINSLSEFILEYTKKIDRHNMIGNKIGIICGKE